VSSEEKEKGDKTNFFELNAVLDSSGSKSYFLVLNGWGNKHSTFSYGHLNSNKHFHRSETSFEQPVPPIHGWTKFWMRFFKGHFQMGRDIYGDYFILNVKFVKISNQTLLLFKGKIHSRRNEKLCNYQETI
jgi:hypothetical protein